MAIDELRQRFGSALRMDEIYRRYPWLERRARRFNLVRSRDVDHLSPEQWKGDLTAESCDIPACYEDGVAQAVAILKSFGYSIDFAAQFEPEDTDLMRPKGGKYPGVSKEVDRSLEDYSSPDADDDTSIIDEHILNFDGEAAVVAEKAARDTELASNPEPHSVWIKLCGDAQKMAHKKAILRTFMDPTLDIDNAKSHDRLLRIRYFSIGGDHWDRTAAKIHSNVVNDDHLLKLQGLFATLIAFDTSRVALALLQCTIFKLTNTNPSQYLDAAPVAEIALSDTRYEVTSQILSLVPFSTSSGLSWAWTTDFVAS
ncbi:hypothetical protein C8R44DRAFT_877078 [Mycena epipterygia]|nr:hypothetical protein C8R44DRAFT_877078 [Mycena epipterygia]